MDPALQMNFNVNLKKTKLNPQELLLNHEKKRNKKNKKNNNKVDQIDTILVIPVLPLTKKVFGVWIPRIGMLKEELVDIQQPMIQHKN